jgi:hypothetical protein
MVFTDGHGNQRRVDEHFLVGKQPVFVLATSGYIDKGPAGDDCVYYITDDFVYQSQYGPVPGTSQWHAGDASVQGTFRFVPGCMEEPTGPPFYVEVGPFPLSVAYPFY